MYLVDGRRYEPNEHGLGRALAAAYDDRIRPLCLCCELAIPVYITRLGGTFVLKRMPSTGSQHAVGCTHYEPPAELSGLGEVLGTAISEDPDTGMTQLRVGFALSKGVPRSVDVGTGQGSGSVRSDGTRLSLRGLLHFLWREAELTRWQPRFSGRRTWGVVRGHLLSAARNMTVRGASLADVLYVPETFSVENRHEIASRRMRRFTNGSQRHRDARPLMVVIGEVKDIVPTRFHFKAIVKHVPDQAFLLDGQLHRRMMKHFERELSLWGGSDAVRMILIATFALNHDGLPTIEELSLMPVTSQWLPVEDHFDLELVQRLVYARRTFEKVLRRNATFTPNSTSAILLDTCASPIALSICRTDEARSSSRDGASEDSFRRWLWRPLESGPPILPQ